MGHPLGLWTVWVFLTVSNLHAQVSALRHESLHLQETLKTSLSPGLEPAAAASEAEAPAPTSLSPLSSSIRNLRSTMYLNTVEQVLSSCELERSDIASFFSAEILFLQTVKYLNSRMFVNDLIQFLQEKKRLEFFILCGFYKDKDRIF